MSALAVRAYEKIPLRLDYDGDIYGETVRDDRSLSMCVSAFHDGRLVTVCSEKVLEDVSIRVTEAVMCCRNRRGSRCPEAIPSCWKGMLKGRCP